MSFAKPRSDASSLEYGAMGSTDDSIDEILRQALPKKDDSPAGGNAYGSDAGAAAAAAVTEIASDDTAAGNAGGEKDSASDDDVPILSFADAINAFAENANKNNEEGDR